jgi:hypothetical protein
VFAPSSNPNIYVRLWTNFAGAGWQFTDYVYPTTQVFAGSTIQPPPGPPPVPAQAAPLAQPIIAGAR